MKTILGAIMAFCSVSLIIFTHAHRPVTSFMDALQRSSTWALNAGPYYFLMLMAIALGIGGAALIYKAIKA